MAMMTAAERAVDRFFAKAPAICARALNRAIVTARTAMVREIAADMKLASGVVKDKIGTYNATPTALRARLTASAQRVPLIAFGASGPEPSRGKGRGVTARLGGSRSRYPHAFIATLASGHRGVFQRVAGANRRGPAPHRSQLPIVELKGPSVALVFVKHVDTGAWAGQVALEKNLQSEMRFALRQTA